MIKENIKKKPFASLEKSVFCPNFEEENLYQILRGKKSI